MIDQKAVSMAGTAFFFSPLHLKSTAIVDNAADEEHTYYKN